MPRGRPRKPASLRAIEGSRARPWHQTEPTYPPGTPDPPVSLTAAELVYWQYYVQQLEAIGVLTPADRDALRLLCEAMVVIDDLKTATSRARSARTKAALTNRQRQWTQTARLCLSDLGLSPVSRGRVGKPAGERPEARLAALIAGRPRS